MPASKRALAKLLDLPAADRRILIKAALLMPAVRLAILLAGLARVMAWIDSAAVARREGTLQEVRTLARLVNIAATHVPLGATCLTRSVLLRWLLLRRGIDAQLRIGVRLAQGGLEAHAWVEFQGQLVNDRAEVCEAFLPFDKPVTMPPRPAS